MLTKNFKDKNFFTSLCDTQLQLNYNYFSLPKMQHFQILEYRLKVIARHIIRRILVIGRCNLWTIGPILPRENTFDMVVIQT